jgi:hypothetical protein
MLAELSTSPRGASSTRLLASSSSPATRPPAQRDLRGRGQPGSTPPLGQPEPRGLGGQVTRSLLTAKPTMKSSHRARSDPPHGSRRRFPPHWSSRIPAPDVLFLGDFETPGLPDRSLLRAGERQRRRRGYCSESRTSARSPARTAAAEIDHALRFTERARGCRGRARSSCSCRSSASAPVPEAAGPAWRLPRSWGRP